MTIHIVIVSSYSNIYVYSHNGGEGYSCYHFVLATVPDNFFSSGYRFELNHCQICGPGPQCSQTVDAGTVRWKSTNPTELERLSAGFPVGPSIDSYNALIVAVSEVYLFKIA